MIRKAMVSFFLVFLGIALGFVFQQSLRSTTAVAQTLTQTPEQPQNSAGSPSPAGQSFADRSRGFQASPPYSAPANSYFVQAQAEQRDQPSGDPSGLVPYASIPIGRESEDTFIAMTAEEAINVTVYERSNRSVVNISISARKPESIFSFAEFEGSGSGIVIDRQGHVLTNFHVIDDATRVNVTLFNGDAFPASIVGKDPDNDIAVLKINAPETMLYPVPWGDSGKLRVGQHVIAIGNPFGLERTMSTGIISSLNRQIKSKTERKIHNIIQIDAALNQGNSGGPLFNAKGELIGMNTAIATRSGDNAGIGFAIPINTVRRVVPQLVATGRAIRPSIGIAKVFETEKGLLIVELLPGGPAELAGVKGSKIERKKSRKGGVLTVEQEVIDHSQSDFIVGIDNVNVKNSDDLLGVIETKKPGDQVVLTVVRSGQMLSIPIRLGGNE